MGNFRQPARSAAAQSQSLALALFEHCLQQTQGALYGFVRNLAGDSEEARDLVQEVYVDAWRVAAQGKAPFTATPNEAACRRWLFHAAYCRVVSLLRHRSVIAWESLDTLAGHSAFGQPARQPFEERFAEGEALRTALAKLEPADAACLVLRVVEGFSSVEIAQILDSTPDATRKRLSRALQRLRTVYLAQEEHTP